uniref:SLC41A/MgtE integral membrane domain-containing protein n=1 Tax=Schizophyllum commune (strain H4-8 / FGSC 9210) TaxID=578458 RepID=D8PUR5_SCHCM
MQRVDQLIMIIPVVLNLKGNLEMNLSARLGTAANTGLLDDGVDDERNVVSLNDEDDGAPHRSSSPHPHLPPSSPSPRRQIITGNLALLQAQAAVVSFVAALDDNTGNHFTSVGSDHSTSGGSDFNSEESGSARPPTTTAAPGGAEDRGFIFLAATATASAALSALLLGAFMCALVVACRRFNLDPDNIAPPVAACLGDLVTLVLVGVLVLSSSGTGIVLDLFVSRYEDFAVLAVVISGLPGSVGSIFTSRLSTELHAGAGREQHERGVGEEGRGLLADEGRGLLADEEDGTPLTAPLTKPSHRRTPSSSHARSPSTASFHRQSSHYPPTPGAPSPHHMSTPHHARPAPPPPPPLTVAITLLLITLPVELIFLAVVRGLGWLELPLLFVGCSVVFFCVAVTISLLVAYHLTKFLWSRGLDPDSNALPLHSALMDLVGQLLLVLCFELDLLCCDIVVITS